MINVIDYGAIGDGTTDDTQAFLDAIAAIKLAGGGELFIPAPFTFMIDPVVVDFNGLTIRGEGYASIIKMNPQNLAVLGDHAIFQISYSSFIKGLDLVDFQIDGNKSEHINIESRTPNMECINLKNVYGGEIKGMYVRNALSEGIDLDTSIGVIVEDNHVYSCDGSGIHVSTSSRRNIIKGNYVENCGHIFSRNGIDNLWGTNFAYDNIFVDNICNNNYRNYRIEGANNKFVANHSLGTPTQPDILTGVV